jgi:Zn finger protein HypA/HybF involved in hydrogenase expression
MYTLDDPAGFVNDSWLMKQLAIRCNSKETVDIRAGNGLFSITKREVKTMQAYCVKCRAKREMKDTKAITMKNGKPATQGVCPTCGTKMFRIGKS